MEINGATVILDDYLARRLAEVYKVPFTGTLGVIVKAKKQGLIPSIKPILKKIKGTNFRMSSQLELEALKAAGEL